MKNYKDSDYALNKYSSGIVYKFADQIIEISLNDYLTENPGKTEQDFQKLKELSDSMYLQQDRNDNAQTKRNISIYSLVNQISSEENLETDYIEKHDKQYSQRALVKLFESGALTEIQKRRFTQYLFQDLSLRQIAKEEGKTFHAIAQSIYAAMDKLKNIFEKI